MSPRTLPTALWAPRSRSLVGTHRVDIHGLGGVVVIIVSRVLRTGGCRLPRVFRVFWGYCRFYRLLVVATVAPTVAVLAAIRLVRRGRRSRTAVQELLSSVSDQPDIGVGRGDQRWHELQGRQILTLGFQAEVDQVAQVLTRNVGGHHRLRRRGQILEIGHDRGGISLVGHGTDHAALTTHPRVIRRPGTRSRVPERV